MADYRCPKHDIIFASTNDHRAPGSPAKDNFPAHPFNGHPDCPMCQKENSQPKTAAAAGTVRRIA